MRLLGASSVHVSGKFAALRRVYTDWRSVWARAVAWHVDSLVHHTAVLAFLPAPNHYIGVPQLWKYHSQLRSPVINNCEGLLTGLSPLTLFSLSSLTHWHSTGLSTAGTSSRVNSHAIMESCWTVHQSLPPASHQAAVEAGQPGARHCKYQLRGDLRSWRRPPVPPQYCVVPLCSVWAAQIARLVTPLHF